MISCILLIGGKYRVLIGIVDLKFECFFILEVYIIGYIIIIYFFYRI